MSTRVRPRLERLERDVGTEEVWVVDYTDRRDGEAPAYQRVPVTEHGERLTRAEFDALPPHAQRLLVVIEDAEP